MNDFEDNVNNELLARAAIEKFCDTQTTRQRDALYDFLNKELNITISRSVYNYSDGRSEYARFECTNEDEVNNVVKRVVRELEKLS